MASIFWVEDQSHWIKKFTPVLENEDFDGKPNTLTVLNFAEAARQKIALTDKDSPPDVALLDAGFVDAFRDLHPDVGAHPGVTHRSGRRIDQLYYKGARLQNTSTQVISTWPTGFPSDHYLIVSAFELDQD